ncbi:Mycothiol acetyltransferase [Pirellulimonas nuda]|uniref:Mycothiol acetyltransferase n=1 Tax=Pirellulimonas nuda TaxID=2528009 RepID=A0A518DB12_9BACT|nr:GNAT family N-acetyltransferase [Pirellulimonas nuda]QDU88652.1 Mycothiol acetyltransferase [Pirellulimonas nuda]
MLPWMATTPSICGCPDTLRLAALRLVLRELPESSQAAVLESMVGIPTGGLDPFSGLLVALSEGQLAAAVWVQPQPGNSAALWIPQAIGELSDATAGGLIDRAASVADAAGVEVVQTLLEPDDQLWPPCLLRSGFRRIALLSYLEWRARHPIVTMPPPPDGLTLRPAPRMHAQLEPLVAATYAGSLDCPAIGGMRSMRHVLDGYRAAGRHEPELWLSVELDGVNAGVLLLADHPDSDQVELVYMGVRPEARGGGLGLQMVRHAQQVTQHRQRERLVLAADVQNDKATAVYAAAGFSEWAQRIAMLRPAGRR